MGGLDAVAAGVGLIYGGVVLVPAVVGDGIPRDFTLQTDRLRRVLSHVLHGLVERHVT